LTQRAWKEKRLFHVKIGSAVKLDEVVWGRGIFAVKEGEFTKVIYRVCGGNKKKGIEKLSGSF